MLRHAYECIARHGSHSTAISPRRLTQSTQSLAKISEARPLQTRPSNQVRTFHSTHSRRCGIVAYVGDYKSGPQADGPAGDNSKMPDLLSAALNRVQHRGPDYVGRWFSKDGRIGLGHTRLAILDLHPTGNQPMSNPSQTVHAVVNGEIYDFEAMRTELQAKGCQFRGHSDSEVALHKYCVDGISMVRHLRGEFAIGIIDEAKGVSHFVRDRHGIKPLYYARHEGRWIFASEMKSLFALGLPAKWNIDNIAALAQVFNHGPIFDGIREVPPGCIATITKRGELTLTRYWDGDYADRHVPETRTEQEMIEGVRERLVDAVRTRLRSDVPVGVYLSGGIDSCTALGIASSLSSKPLDAYNISFSTQSRFDEFTLAEGQAKMSGARMHRVEVSEDMMADQLEQSLWHCEQAVLNTNGVGKYILSKFVRDHGGKVVLTGEGSDEIFAGYSFFRQDLAQYHTGLSDAERDAIIESLKRGNMWQDNRFTGILTPEQVHKLNYAFGYTPSFVATIWPPSLMTEMLSPVAREQIGVKRDQIEYIISLIDGSQARKMKETWEPVSGSLYLESKTLLPGMLLTVLGDRAEMAHSIEGRLPFLDAPLVEYVNQLPTSVKIKGTREKWILREAARPFITDDIYNRVKHPYLAPPAFMNQKTKLHDLVQTTIRSPALKDLWWLDADKLVKQLDDLTAMLKTVDPKTMTIDEREKYAAMLFGADIKFLSITSYVLLRKLFNVE